MRPLITSKKSHKKTVFAWGAFDLIHAGHIEYLKKARALGDTLIVAVFSDAVFSRLHDKTRPAVGVPTFIPQKERMEILSAFSFVDRVILLAKKSPIDMIEKLNPDIVVSCDLALSDAVDNLNIAFVPIKLRSRQSTSGIVEKIKNFCYLLA